MLKKLCFFYFFSGVSFFTSSMRDTNLKFPNKPWYKIETLLIKNIKFLQKKILNIKWKTLISKRFILFSIETFHLLKSLCYETPNCGCQDKLECFFPPKKHIICEIEKACLLSDQDLVHREKGESLKDEKKNVKKCWEGETTGTSLGETWYFVLVRFP